MTFRPYYLGKYLLKNGYQPVIIGCGYHHQMLKPKNIGKKVVIEYIDQIPYLWLPSRIYKTENYIKRVLNMMGFCVRLFFLNLNKFFPCHNVGAIISSSPSLFTSLNAYHLSKKMNTRFVFELRDIWPRSLYELGGYSRYHPLFLFMKAIERFSYKKCHKLVSVLPQARDYVISNGLERDKYVFIPNGVDLDGNHQEIDPQTREFARLIPQSKFIVGYAGSFGVASSVDIFVESAKLLRNHPNIHFLIVGRGPKENHLRRLAQTVKNITFLPLMSRKGILEIIRKFDICYIGLRKASVFHYGISPNKLLDYMLIGKPVVQAVSCSNNIVEEARCGISVEPENPYLVRDAILKLLHMEKKQLDAMSANGRNYILKNHLYRDLINTYIEKVLL